MSSTETENTENTETYSKIQKKKLPKKMNGGYLV